MAAAPLGSIPLPLKSEGSSVALPPPPTVPPTSSDVLAAVMYRKELLEHHEQGMPGDFAADYQQATLYIKRLEATVVPMDDAPLWAHQLKNDFNEMCNTVNEMHNTVNEMHNTVKEMYNTVNETNNRLLRVEETLDNMTDVKNIAKEQAKMWNLSQLSGSSGSVGGSESTKARDKEKGRAIKSIRGE